MKFTIIATGIGGLSAALACTAPAIAADPDWLDEIVVTATLRDESLRSVPGSVSVLPAKTLKDAGVQHFEDVLGLVPNLNWAGASSRPRYFQLRGIGELEQYQGAPNPSVGFLIDDIDFSGIGMAATLFDVEQIEVLRGPQGTRYGAYALAGLIKFKTRDPDPELTARTELTLGQDDTRSLGAAVSGPLGSDAIGFRLSLQDYRSNGFRHNAYLGRDDTNQRDELSARGKLHWAASPRTTVDLTALYADLANGYDAFAIDNSYTTLSDKPGRDSQRSLAAAVRVEHRLTDSVDVLALATWARSNLEQSFDGDWGNDVDWGIFAPYDYTSRTLRQHDTATAELRVSSTNGTNHVEAFGERSWVAGVYYLKLDEDNDGLDIYNGDATALTSTYGAGTLAAYGQMRWPLGGRFSLTSGLRLERWSADYRDSNTEHFEPADTMWGGELALGFQVDEARTAYFAISRGFKTGGFNIGAGVPDDRRRFGAETLANIELGLKGGWLAGRVTGDVSLFYSRRQNQQVSTSIQPDPTNPLFVFYTDNARGENYGLESSWRWAVTERWDLGATLGLLKTRYIDYFFGDRDLDGREQASAPEYEYSMSVGYRHPRGWLAHVDVAGKDNFYFDASNDQQSHAYTLVNVRFGYAGERWSATVWGRNIFDVRYAVRGFYFGNEPPNFPDKLYLRLGDPRQWGVTFDYRF